MPAHSDIDVRMKENYEHPYRIKLTKRMPVIIRVDGKAFHTFTKGFQRPFDLVLIAAMQDTTKFLCENIMGCKLGYVQSDEISLLLTDYDTFSTQPYFDYNIQKLASISASMATLAFNRAFKERADAWFDGLREGDKIASTEAVCLYKKYQKAIEKGAMFDSRCFNIPREEVTNYFYSRQIDASRNSVEMFGRAYFSDKDLHCKNTSVIQDMVHETFALNWNDLPVEQKRGSCCIKTNTVVHGPDGSEVERSSWIIDHDIPQFKGEGREYVDRFVNIDQLSE